jgi:hypothetical protein
MDKRKKIDWFVLSNVRSFRAFSIYSEWEVADRKSPTAVFWTCHAFVPLLLLIYAAFASKAKGLFQPRFQTHNQNMTVAASAIAERKTLGQRYRKILRQDRFRSIATTRGLGRIIICLTLHKFIYRLPFPFCQAIQTNGARGSFWPKTPRQTQIRSPSVRQTLPQFRTTETQ